MHNTGRSISYKNSLALLGKLGPVINILDVNLQKNVIVHKNNKGQTLFRFQFPLTIHFDEFPQKERLAECMEKIPDVYILLIQAGNAALGVISHGELCEHKVIRKYMIRKKQGKAQIKYLNTKGKSRAGSRIRLAKTVEFLEEINLKFAAWNQIYSAESILYSCTPTLWGMLFRSKTSTPFEKKDPRLKKIPRDVAVPNYREMVKTLRYVSSGYLQSDPACPPEITRILNTGFQNP